MLTPRYKVVGHSLQTLKVGNQCGYTLGQMVNWLEKNQCSVHGETLTTGQIVECDECNARWQNMCSDSAESLPKSCDKCYSELDEITGKCPVCVE